MSQPTDRRDSNNTLSRQKKKSDFVDRVQVVEDDRYAFTLISPPLTKTARVVDVSMNIERVFDVDTVTQTFGVQVSVMMTWLMPCFEEPKPPEQDDGDWIPEWTPKYKFNNLMENIDDSESYFPYVDENGVKKMRLEAVHVLRVYEQMELEKFPVDCQDLSLELVMKQTSKFIFLQPLVEEGKPSFHLQEANCFLNDFVLMETPCVFALYLTTPRLKKMQDPNLEAGVMQPGSYGKCVIGAQVKLERMQMFYVSNVIGVLFPIASFALSAWSLHPADIEGRLAVDFQLILTAVAFKLVLNSMTPNVSYLTVLDIYVLGCFAFLSVVTVYHSAFPSVYGVNVEDFSPLSHAPSSARFDEHDFVDWDVWCYYIFLGIWTLFNLVFAYYFRKTQHVTRKEFIANALDEVYRSEVAMAQITKHVWERDPSTSIEYQFAASVKELAEEQSITIDQGIEALLVRIGCLDVLEKLDNPSWMRSLTIPNDEANPSMPVPHAAVDFTKTETPTTPPRERSELESYAPQPTPQPTPRHYDQKDGHVSNLADRLCGPQPHALAFPSSNEMRIQTETYRQAEIAFASACEENNHSDASLNMLGSSYTIDDEIAS